MDRPDWASLPPLAPRLRFLRVRFLRVPFLRAPFGELLTRWRVSRLAKKVEQVATIRAKSEAAGLARVVEEHGISDPAQQKRLIAHGPWYNIPGYRDCNPGLSVLAARYTVFIRASDFIPGTRLLDPIYNCLLLPLTG